MARNVKNRSDKKTKLAIFTEGDIRSFGGAERYVIESSRRLKNFDITIFSYKNEKNKRVEESEVKKLLEEKVKITFFKAITIPILEERIPLSFSGLRVLWSLSSFDTIYIVDPSLPTIFMILLFLRVKHAKTKIIFGAHDPGFLRSKPIIQSSIRSFLLKVYRPLRKVVIFSIPNIHVLNEDDLNMLKEEGYKGRIYHIPNFLYYKKNQIRIKENKKKFIVLFGGRLAVYHKGIDLLVKIIEKVLELNKDIEFHIFGSGEDGQKLIEELNKKYPNNVRYLGFIPNKQLEKEYQEASLYIITSRIESFSLVTLEAQAHGLPVIAFDIKGPHDIIKKDFQGKLIEPFDIDKFIKAILYYYTLWKKRKLSANYKRQIINYIVSNYSEEKIMPNLEKMFKK
jgi:glycosyltransferase involved in cell wall biosynthesis